ncbi:hypothetical protein LAZ67_X002891 [Cordylochernes scorpioides]|uniref:Gag-pol polyprotein n=1 Tax=Cordylochernes scorpioides TaxID=51811 RepID=A0ABY6LXU8_9ARAC|nr:hypothetical protein LAZ67_X002891 [Cordylochernes scorpioides]
MENIQLGSSQLDPKARGSPQSNPRPKSHGLRFFDIFLENVLEKYREAIVRSEAKSTDKAVIVMATEDSVEHRCSFMKGVCSVEGVEEINSIKREMKMLSASVNRMKHENEQCIKYLRDEIERLTKLLGEIKLSPPEYRLEHMASDCSRQSSMFANRNTLDNAEIVNIPSHGRDQYGNLPIVKVNINGNMWHLLYDTGSQVSIIDSEKCKVLKENWNDTLKTLRIVSVKGHEQSLTRVKTCRIRATTCFLGINDIRRFNIPLLPIRERGNMISLKSEDPDYVDLSCIASAHRPMVSSSLEEKSVVHIKNEDVKLPPIEFNINCECSAGSVNSFRKPTWAERLRVMRNARETVMQFMSGNSVRALMNPRPPYARSFDKGDLVMLAVPKNEGYSNFYGPFRVEARVSVVKFRVSGVNMHDVKFVRVDRMKAFRNRKFRIVSILEGKELDDLLEGDPPEDEVKFKEWKKKDAQAKGIITCAMTDSLVALILNCKTSKDIWIALHERYEGDKKKRIIEARNDVSRLIMRKEENWEEYLYRAEKLLEQARNLGAEIEDQEFTTSVIRGLPQKYNLVALQLNCQMKAKFVNLQPEEHVSNIKEYETTQQPEEWVIDSGASCHMTSNRDLLKEEREVHKTIKLAYDSEIISNAEGAIEIEGQNKLIRLNYALYVEKCQAKHPRTPFKPVLYPQSTRPLDLIHIDLIRPIQEESIGGAKYDRTLIEGTRALLIDSQLPLRYWAETMSTFAYLKNRIPRKKLGWITPEERFSNRKPTVAHLKIFGCIVYYYVHKHKRGKLQPTAKAGIFVGYSSTRKAWRLIDPENENVIETRDVIFLENKLGKEILNKNDSNDTQKYFLHNFPEETILETSEEVENHDDHSHSDLENQDEHSELPYNLRPNLKDKLYYELSSDDETIEDNEDKDPTYDPTVGTLKLSHGNSLPSSYEEAINHPDSPLWQQAMDKEIHSLQNHHVWDLTELPEGAKAIKSKWIFSKKMDPQTNQEIYKARLVALGCSQE